LADNVVAMIKRILYATDLGLYSPYIMKSLARLALSTGACVHVLHVIEPMGVFAESILRSYISEKDRRHLHQYGLDEVLNTIRSQVTETLENDFTDLLKGVKIDSVYVEIGKPAQVILEHSSKVKADMIVMGSRGQYSPDSSSLGSISNKVLQGAVIPVMVIPMMGIDGLDRLT